MDNSAIGKYLPLPEAVKNELAKYSIDDMRPGDDAPLQLWAKEEYEDLLAKESDYMGAVYKCHKNNGSVCVGWLMKQDENRLPSIMLRVSLSKHGITREYMDSLHSPAPLYEDVRTMIEANYPELI